uniref:Gastric intrinsic factor n=1 Tax=Cyanistes caeruleus TaxID=156563 RepID=A0A8C0ZGB2_CYACU
CSSLSLHLLCFLMWMMHRAPADLPSVAEGCQATVTHHHLVQKLLQRMEESIKFDEPPNPSILLAMNLAGATHGHIHRWLLQEIKKNAAERAQTDMTSGQVALHVLTLLSSCQNPWRSMEPSSPAVPTLLPVSPGCWQWHWDPTDTQTMVVLALVCAYNHTDKQDLIHDALKVVNNDFLDEQERRNGMIRDIYSMGLALQALETSSEFYAPQKWNCAQAFSVVYNQDYTTIAQLLSCLMGKSYLNAGGMCQVPTLALSLPTASIMVQLSITNTLKNYFHYSTLVCVPDNSTLLRVMKVARNEKPDIFCFQTEQTSWGPYVTSIHGLAGNKTERTYWQFFSCWSPLQKGGHLGDPKNWEHIQAVFSTY